MTQLAVLRDRVNRTLAPAQVRDRFVAVARTTPGRLNLYLVGLTVLGLLTGVVAVVGAVNRGADVDAVASASGPLAVQAQGIYRSLSDADATAATAFLSSGAEPPALRQRYLDDVAAASSALATAAATSDAARDAVTRIATSLPVYTGLVETARTQNRLNLPVGAAYLREASALMRGTLLPAANDLYQAATAGLADDRDHAESFPWLTVLLIVATLVGLGAVQYELVGRTQRLLNVGLVVASAAGIILLLWVWISWAVVVGNLDAAGRDGSAQVQAVAAVRIDALQARADEALTLVARGSGGEFEDDFKTRMAGLLAQLDQATAAADDPTVHSELSTADSQLRQWQNDHQSLRKADDAGQYPDAVTAAVGPQSTLFNSIDGHLQKAITLTEATFDDRAARASDALTGAAAGWAVLAVALLAGLVVGLEQRITEYR
jgi:hypothetical protein